MTVGTDCPRCGRATIRDASGECVGCQARENIERGMAERQRQDQADRARLGLHPREKGRALVRLSIEAAQHWAGVCARAGAPVSDTAVQHLESARRELR